MKYFVDEHSIVRKIWGKGDTVLFVFAGASAEFALNKAVDWLYFTGRLPADPLGRLFSTVMYAREIVFSETAGAERAIDKINAIHGAIEDKRGYRIPDWAYRDVLFMLIHYSLAAQELLERKLTDTEKEDLLDVFYRMGVRMGLKELPRHFPEWVRMREEHMKQDLEKSRYTIDLYRQYRKHLGWVRYRLLIESQKLVVPGRVRELLGFSGFPWIRPILSVYKFSRIIRLDGFLKSLVMPRQYKKQIHDLDINPAGR
jgi:hypothetical protein